MWLTLCELSICVVYPLRMLEEALKQVYGIQLI